MIVEIQISAMHWRNAFQSFYEEWMNASIITKCIKVLLFNIMDTQVSGKRKITKSHIYASVGTKQHSKDSNDGVN